MPLVIHPRVRKAACRVAALSCVAMFASTGAALASPCGSAATSTPFSQFGDTSSYFLVPGGDFAGTTTRVGWTLNNATLTASDSPAAAGIGTENQSLLINGGGNATSPTFCLDSTMPSFRFLAKQTAAGGNLQVLGVVELGRWQITVPVTTIADGSMPAWAPVAKINLPTPLLGKWRKLPVMVRFQVPAGSAGWEIGGVYVDPYRLD